MPFELPSLGSMSRSALFQTCCAISDVEDPAQLDMEFVGGALKAVDATLGSFPGHSANLSVEDCLAQSACYNF